MSIRKVATFLVLVSVFVWARWLRGAEADVSKDLQTLKQALSVVGPSPEEAFDTCAEIVNADLQSECFGAVGQVVAYNQPDLAEKACKRTKKGVDRFECYFRLAEEARRIEICAKAGPFTRPCSHHLWSDALPGILWGSDWQAKSSETRYRLTPVGGFEAALETNIISFSLDPTDESYWDLAYRAVFLQQCPVNIATCLTDAPSLLRKSCVRGARRAIDSGELMVGSAGRCTTIVGGQAGEALLTGKGQ